MKAKPTIEELRVKSFITSINGKKVKGLGINTDGDHGGPSTPPHHTIITFTQTM